MISTIEIQRALYRLGFDVGGVDGISGPKTKAAIAAFREASSGTAPEMPLDVALADALEAFPPFIEARNYTRGGMLPVKLIVIHTAEAPEIHREAFNVAGWFAQQPVDGTIVDGKRFGGSSAHYVVDDENVVQCVLECDRAWHAGQVNPFAIGIEHAGFASQTPEQWNDDYSKAVLARSAALVAGLCKRFDVPMVKLSVDELKAGAAGIVGHVDVTDAFSAGHGHRDPGPSFNWPAYIAAVKGASDGPK